MLFESPASGIATPLLDAADAPLLFNAAAYTLLPPFSCHYFTISDIVGAEEGHAGSKEFRHNTH